MTGKPNRRNRNIRWALLCVAVPVAYLLSFAPAYRFLGLTTHTPTFYKPAEFVMDRTPLAGPMLLWSSVWGVREDMEVDRAARQLDAALSEPFDSK